MDLALGEIGLKRDEVLRMTWGDLWRTIYGYWIRQEREWDRTRHIVAIIYNVNRGKNKPYKKPQRILPLAIDRMGHHRQEWTEEKYQIFERALTAWGLKKEEDNGSTEQCDSQD